MRLAYRLLLCLLLLGATACSGSDEAAPSFAPPPTTRAVATDEVPTIQELLDTGLSNDQATCFITTIDPDGTGRVASAELFMTALSECT